MDPGLQECIKRIKPYYGFNTTHGCSLLSAQSSPVPFFFQFIWPDQHKYFAVFGCRASPLLCTSSLLTKMVMEFGRICFTKRFLFVTNNCESSGRCFILENFN